MIASAKDKAIKKGREEGREEERANILHQAHKAGLTNRAIADIFQLSEAEVDRILAGDQQ